MKFTEVLDKLFTEEIESAVHDDVRLVLNKEHTPPVYYFETFLGGVGWERTKEQMVSSEDVYADWTPQYNKLQRPIRRGVVSYMGGDVYDFKDMSINQIIERNEGGTAMIAIFEFEEGFPECVWKYGELQ